MMRLTGDITKMKGFTYKGLRLASFGAVFLGIGACDPDKLTRVNEDPNNPTSAPPQAVFTYATRRSMERWFGGNPGEMNLRATELTVQHLAQVQYPDEDAYVRLDGVDTDNSFIFTYASELKNFQSVVDAGTAADQPLLWAPAQIMRSLLFGYVTDVWGDIPFREALQGDAAEAVILPAYDPQEAIYDGLFADLSEAVTAISGAPSSAVTLGGADPIYGGTRVSWQRFANSLRARHAIRLANVDLATAQAQLAAAIAAPGGLIQSNADNAQMSWPGDGIYDNPWSENNQTRDDHRLSDRLMGQMLPYNDPRVPVYAQPTLADETVYAGMPNALSEGEAAEYSLTSSRPGEVFYGTDLFCADCHTLPGASFPSFIMTFAEVSFILAEAAERGWIAGSAATYYNQGIRASMEQWGVTDDAAIDAYIAQPGIAYTPGVAGQRQIALQKWIALYTDGVTAWSEWRRTCVPETVRPGPQAIINTIPRRYQYSIREHSVNSANVDAAIARQGPDDFTTRMYWDTNPTAAPTYPGASCGVRP
jgi:hypothetical protein